MLQLLNIIMKIWADREMTRAARTAERNVRR